ncbi:MAG: ferredoxin [Mesorhizobium sp.]|nr:ferredoxin [Mesorhizobium sp.]MCO5161804.1 ferredoxin [Mesorhizobium sp.]
MANVVTEGNVARTHMDCVDVRTVDCFDQDGNVGIIHRGEWIDCSVCKREYPADAIKPDLAEPAMEQWTWLKRKYVDLCPNRVTTGTPPANAWQMRGEPNEIRDLFSQMPGGGW